ncbi:MAG: DUF4276 family protein [bacterium]
MSRLLVHVEGQTEETFVNEILRPHLVNFGYTAVSARLVGNARQKEKRGGIRDWVAVRKEIINHLWEDIGCIATTMVDYYALPQTWPGRAAAGGLQFPHKAATIEDALLADICKYAGSSFNATRFIPYVMMHEFEGLLFSNCERFANGIERPNLAREFQAIRDQFDTPEEINDSVETAPSKRIKTLVPGYNKPLLGALAALEIGIEAIRSECPHFRAWLERLEKRAVNR